MAGGWSTLNRMGDGSGYPKKAELAGRLVRAIDLLSIDEALRIFHDDVELTTILEHWTELPRLRGHGGIRIWFDRMKAFWAFAEVEEWSYEELGDWVLVSGRSRVRGKASPDEFLLPWYAAARITDAGRVDVLGLYLTREEALERVERPEH